MLASILQAAGYKTGLYTSPHLKDYRERIRVNGEMIPQAEIVAYVSQLEKMLEPNGELEGITPFEPSFFEASVGLAFQYFKQSQVDIAVIETGMGGRLDSTNVITPLVSLITNIGWDHADTLGDTLEAIAGEKAGIIKENVPVIVSEKSSETDTIFIDKAAVMNAPISFGSDVVRLDGGTVAGQYTASYRLGHSLSFMCDLLGPYQSKNLSGVLAAVEELKKLEWNISKEAIAGGLANAGKRTGLKGRWQVLGKAPFIVADTAHNEHGLKAVLGKLKDMVRTAGIPKPQLHIVFGVVREKDLSKIMPLLPLEAIYYLAKPGVLRGLPAEELGDTFLKAGYRFSTYKLAQNALDSARGIATPDDYILVCGSTFLLADIEEV
jgi:dihydrofolate synthase / folylpolyglutamate synthase